MRFLFFTIPLFIVFLLSAAQADNPSVISGVIRSAEDNTALAGANVYLDGTSIGVISTPSGRFKLMNIPKGMYTLKIDYIGYSEQSIPIQLSSDTTLQVQLNRSILSGPMVSVTATEARERVTPITFSQIDKQTLSTRYTNQDIPELISELPSATFYSESGAGLGYNYLSIRGFDQRRISVLINGIPQNDPEDHNIYWVDFPDLAANVQQIQVQRGAGSAFYGPAAIGGSINMVTNYFSPNPKLSAYAGWGSFNTSKLSLAYNSGLLFNKYVLYGRVSNMKTDGYRNRGWVNFWSYFLGAAYYGKNQNLRIHYFGGPIKDGLIYEGLPKFFNDDENLRRKNYSYWGTNDAGDSLSYFAERRNDESEWFNQPHLELLHEYKLAPNMNLRNTLFYIRGYGYFDYDGSWGTPDYFRLTPEYGFNDSLAIPSDALIRAYVDNNQLGWLPQFSWQNGDEELVLGAELRTHRSLHWGRLQKGNGLPANIIGEADRHYYQYKGSKNVASVYLHQTHKIWPKLIFMGDLQYAFKQYRLYDEHFLHNDFSVHYQFLNPRVGLNYNISAKSNFYMSLSHTSREPRLKNYYDAAEASTPESWGSVVPEFELNSSGSYDFSKPLVKPETLTGLEIGYTYHSERLQGFINLYSMSFVDEIIKKGTLDRFGQPVTGNAPNTIHRGVELGGKFQISSRFSLNGNVSYSDNRLIIYSVYDWSGNETILDGNPIAGFPNFLANLRFNYIWNDVYASLAARYSGKMYTDNFANEANTVDAFFLLNLNARWKMAAAGLNGLSIQLKLNNLLNTKYLAYGEGNSFFPAATRNGFIGLQLEY